MKENFNKADYAAREEARGRKEKWRCHAADGNQHLHLRNKPEGRKDINLKCTVVKLCLRGQPYQLTSYGTESSRRGKSMPESDKTGQRLNSLPVSIKTKQIN